MKWTDLFDRKKSKPDPEMEPPKLQASPTISASILEGFYPRESRRVYPQPVKTIVAIPGTWKSHTEFILALVEASDGQFIAAGNIVINAPNQRHYVFDFCDPNPQLAKGIAFTGRITGIDEDSQARINDHSSIVYLTAECSSEADTGYLAFAVGAVLAAGGVGVNVETAGKGFSKSFWLEQLSSFRQSTLHTLFVIDPIVSKDGSMYSCGMRNLGLKDTIVAGFSAQDAHELINLFGIYQIIDRPTILPGQTFSPTANSPRFRITDELNQPYQGVEVFENPFGMWRLALNQ